MRCNLALRQLTPVLVALGLVLHGTAAHAVKLAISSATVAQAGGDARVCVSLITDGKEVAGTQNDLVWDGTCMTLNEGACYAAGTHGKQVNTRIQNSADFRMRVLVLSLSDVDPIDDGVLYCCNVQGEAPAGSCCSISVVNTGASDSKGNAVGGVGGNSGQLCTQGGSASGSGGAIGAVNGAGSRMGGGSQMGGSGFGASEGAAGAGMGSGVQAPPANQVQRGGGGGVPAPAAPVGQPAAPVIAVPGAAVVAQVPTAVAVPTRAAPAVPPNVAPGALAAPVAPVPALAPATLAATAPAADATAPPTPADTATAAVPTKLPPTKAPASTPTAPRATPTAERGWFGCQIADGASAAPPLALALLLAALAGVRRRRPPQR